MMNKKVLTSVCLGLTFAVQSAVAADCAPTETAYASEKDDTGTKVPLAYQCRSEYEIPHADWACIYLSPDKKLAAVRGSIDRVSVTSFDLFRRSIEDDEKQLFLQLETSLFDSLFNSKTVEFTFDKDVNIGFLRSVSKGFDIYRGADSDGVSARLNCSTSGGAAPK